MFRSFFALAGALLFSLGLSATDLQAYFSFNQFHSPDKGPYIETYLTVLGNTVEFAENSSGKYQALVEVTLIVKQNGEIIDFKKYELNSPETPNDSTLVDFIDQQRFVLPNGGYEMEIELKDLNAEEAQPFASVQEFSIEHPEKNLFVSDVELIESFYKSEESSVFTKSGYDLFPMISNYYPAELNELAFYAEIYNSDAAFGENQGFLTSYYIEGYENKKTIGEFKKFNKQESKPVNVVLHKFDISELGTGNYNLVLEVRNRENELVSSKKIFFQRFKSINKMKLSEISKVEVNQTFATQYDDYNVLREHIYSLRPLSTDSERNLMDRRFPKSGAEDLELMQQFFYSFWYNRNANDPEGDWKIYEEEVKKVDELFGTRVKEGYETDQGATYLKYGAPNTVTDRPNEPLAYPYQIWHYYKVGNFNNKRFVFYSREIVSSEYVLLHSDLVGEPKDFRWQYTILKRNNQNQSIDETGGQEQYGGRIDDFFTNPR